MQSACTSQDNSEKIFFRFALHSSRYADCSHEERATDSHTVRYSNLCLERFWNRSFSAGAPVRGLPSCPSMLAFSLLYAFDFFYIKNEFFLCGYTAGFPLARACPSCRGGHLLSLRGESKQRLAKGHLWNPFGEQFLNTPTKATEKALQ